MKKETKSEVILEFIKDLKELIQKIENNEETMQDYILLQEMFELSNVPDDYISDCYLGSGFQNWNELYHSRRKNSRQAPNNKHLESAISKIRGISSAIISVMQKYVAENSNLYNKDH
ncbi:MAG TPA: hypothetical protein PLB46_07135 [Chitinophagales bacterium]|nr:hypothetical protein [Chitinophagales bacterium]